MPSSWCDYRTSRAFDLDPYLGCYRMIDELPRGSEEDSCISMRLLLPPRGAAFGEASGARRANSGC